MKHNFKLDDLVYTKNVGYPYNKIDDGGESWEGASCIVTKLEVNKDYIEVKSLFPIKTRNGFMDSCVFFPEQLIKENRPWLKKHLKDIIRLREKLVKISEDVLETINC